MSVICTQENHTLTAAVSGELDHHAAKAIMSELERQVDAALEQYLPVADRIAKAVAAFIRKES